MCEEENRNNWHRIEKSFSFLGFTLAEVLITLMIIGVIAVITIPPLVSAYQKNVYATQLKKFYTEFNQALQQMAVDYGCPGDLQCTGIFDYDAGNYQFDSVYIINLLANYIKIDKICGPHAPQGATDLDCFGYNLSNRPYEYLNGDTTTTAGGFYELSIADRNWATLNNGAFFGILNSVVTSPSHCHNGTCSYLYVDINGAKSPNQIGRDVFWFTISKKATLMPYGSSTGGTTTTPACDPATGHGQLCSITIMNDGWQMNY